MVELAGPLFGVALLCALGLLLDAARVPRWVSGIPLAIAGAVSGFLGTLILALATWPGACVAVLCPSCYREPAADAVWGATLTCLVVVGIAVATLPGERFRLGFALGAAPGALEVAGHAFDAGAGSAVLLAAAVALSLAAVRHEVASRLGGPVGSGALGPGDGGSPDFWDGGAWRPSPRPRHGHPGDT